MVVPQRAGHCEAISPGAVAPRGSSASLRGRELAELVSGTC